MVALLATSCSLGGPADAGSINLYLSVDKSTLAIDDSMTITVTARNVGYDPLTLTGPSACLLYIEVRSNKDRSGLEPRLPRSHRDEEILWVWTRSNPSPNGTNFAGRACRRFTRSVRWPGDGARTSARRSASRSSEWCDRGSPPERRHPRDDGRPMSDRRRARMVLGSLLVTFIIVRLALWRSPDSDFDIAGYNIHHLFTGILLTTAGGIPLVLRSGRSRGLDVACLAYGAGLALTLDEVVYLIATDGSNASYLQPVSFWGGIVVVGLGVILVLAVDWGGRDSGDA
jgi:hypothetical protein